MRKEKFFIEKKTLKLLENQPWNTIRLSDIIKDNKKYSIKNKNQILVSINRYFDFMLKESLSNLEKSSKKDMLFEVYMARLDILNLHRNSIKNLIRYFISKPQDFVKLIPSYLDSIVLIATLSNIKIDGVKGIAVTKALFTLYLIITYTWYNDDSDSLEKTMTTLDKYLSNIDKFINII